MSTAPTPSVKSKRSRASAESSESSEQVKMLLALQHILLLSEQYWKFTPGARNTSSQPEPGLKSTPLGRVAGQRLHSNLRPTVEGRIGLRESVAYVCGRWKRSPHQLFAEHAPEAV